MRSVCLFVSVILAACGPNNRDNGHGVDGNGGDDGNNGGGDGNNGCTAASMFVYTVDENNTFSQFDPASKTFTDLGHLSCPASFGATPFSMGLDRNTIAWVLYSSGELFRVDVLNSLACTKTTWSHPAGLMQFGMGFSTNMAGGQDDTLFIAGGAGPTDPTSTLAMMSTSAFTEQTVGTIQGWPELTGNGNAELWGWFPDANSPRVEKIDKTSGTAAQTFNLPALRGMPTAWAFAFWGGDYWIFLAKDADLATTVYQIDGTNGSVKGQTATNTRTIVGAGVSTCAPVVIF